MEQVNSLLFLAKLISMQEGDTVLAFDAHKWLHTPRKDMPHTNFMMPAVILNIRPQPFLGRTLVDIEFKDGKVRKGRNIKTLKQL